MSAGKKQTDKNGQLAVFHSCQIAFRNIHLSIPEYNNTTIEEYHIRDGFKLTGGMVGRWPGAEAAPEQDLVGVVEAVVEVVVEVVEEEEGVA